MKLPTSNKTASFGKKPWIKKGYYPAKLLKVDPYASKDGVLVEGTYGHQLIFEFAIYSKDENDTPVAPMIFSEEDRDDVPVKISKFVYHEYKVQAPKEGEPLYRTAITPNSKITETLQALGWKFSEEDVDLEPLVGNWVEVNIDDYKAKAKDGEQYTASTIKDVNPYNGKEVKNVEDVNPTEAPKKVEKQMSHEDVKESETKESEEIEKLKGKLGELKKLHSDGYLSDDGLKQGTESLETEIEGLRKQ